MKLNIITVKTKDDFNAGQKAPADIIHILTKYYNARSTIFDNCPSNNKIIKIFKRIIKIFKFPYEFLKSRIRKEIVVLQFPLFETTKFLNFCLLQSMKLLNPNKTIILIHDLEGLRNKNDILKKQEMNRFKHAKYIIVHNNVMKNVLVNEGLNNKIYVLELFDYICDLEKRNYKQKLNKSFEVVYAGNLTKVKCPFIYELNPNKMNYIINLYGLGIDKDINAKIKYKNKYSPAALPNKIKGDLGLIWDGNADESDESIGMKYYTKYNNPHKLSCYIAAGLPVIAWKKAAISEFIKKNKIGYLINNIEDINELDLSDYNEKIKAVSKIREKVTSGWYTKNVFDKIFKDMGL